MQLHLHHNSNLRDAHAAARVQGASIICAANFPTPSLTLDAQQPFELGMQQVGKSREQPGQVSGTAAVWVQLLASAIRARMMCMLCNQQQQQTQRCLSLTRCPSLLHMRSHPKQIV